MHAVVWGVGFCMLFLALWVTYWLLARRWETTRDRDLQQAKGKTLRAPLRRTYAQQWQLMFEEANASRRFEGELVWNRYSGVLVSLSILTALTGLALWSDLPSKQRPPNELLLILCGAGWALCLVWVVLTHVGIVYIARWGKVVRFVEDRHPRRTHYYGCLKAMRCKQPRRQTTLRMRTVGRLQHPRPHDAQYATILVFAAIYSAIAGWLVAVTAPSGWRWTVPYLTQPAIWVWAALRLILGVT